MTEREILELILNKLTNLEVDMKTLQKDVKDLQKGQAQLEKGQAQLEKGQAQLEKGQAQLQSDIAIIKSDLVRLENKIDTNHTNAMDTFINLRLDFMDLNDKVNKHERLIKQLDRNYPLLHERVGELEETVEQIKEKLAKAS